MKIVNMNLTIIFSTHNSKQEYVDGAINSILNQTNQNFEVLIVDDASNEECVKMLEDIAKSDDRISLFHQEMNKGVSASRNLGIEKAKGEYVTFLDDDDYLKDDFVDRMLSEVSKDNVDILTCNFEKKTGIVFEVNPYETENGKIYTDKGELEKIAACVIDPKTVGTGMRLLMLGSAWGKVYRRQFLLDNPEVRYPEGMMGGEDAVFFIKALQTQNSPRVKMIKDALYVYRKNEESYTVGYQPKLPEQNEERLRWFYKLSQGHPLMERATKRNACYAIMDMCSVYLADEKCPIKDKKKYLKDTLKRPEYRKALESLGELGYDFSKRMIYTFAKVGLVTPVLMAGRIYRKSK